jgi:uncharacterized protein YdiU (UPF0061 family)
MSFDNTYARELEGLHVRWQPAAVPAPRLAFFNAALAAELGLDAATWGHDDVAAVWAGNRVPEGAEPIAQAYAGHQFGGFSPQLGDGRALLLGEVVDARGQRRDIALKGSGRTPFSRGGDGKAAIGPMLREVLFGEAMHALGIPTTRALAVATTGESIRREHLLPGAVLTRVAASHLRVGTFQYFASRGEHDKLARLLDYAVDRHDPELAALPTRAERALGLLAAVVRRQAELVANWMNVGFIHGVLNTDNTTISGETIDYGPCAFMEAYDPQAVFSSIDHGGRYAFGRQAPILLWNLSRLAEALLPLVVEPEAERAGGAEPDEAAVKQAVQRVTAVLEPFPGLFDAAWRRGQAAKLGLAAPDGSAAADVTSLADDWLTLLHRGQVDFTLAWRRLADAAAGDDIALKLLFRTPEAPETWLARWRTACAEHDARFDRDPAARVGGMRAASPFTIPRHHRVEAALAAASDRGDFAPFEALLAALRRPFDEAPELAAYGEPAPAEATARYQTFCGT